MARAGSSQSCLRATTGEQATQLAVGDVVADLLPQPQRVQHHAVVRVVDEHVLTGASSSSKSYSSTEQRTISVSSVSSSSPTTYTESTPLASHSALTVSASLTDELIDAVA